MMLKKLIILQFTLIALVVSFSAFANPVIPVPTQPLPPTFTPGTPNLNAKAYILIDANSGRILAQKDIDLRLPPASLTKLMSVYLISMALKNNQIHMDDKVRISTNAWKTEGSRMFVKAGDEVPVKSLLEGIIVASGNDATVALAEHLAGTEETFTSLLNQQAKLLGMNNSHFMDSTGLPNKEHYSTARDLALLTQAYIKNFPEDYSFHSEKWFTYNGIKQRNRNRLLWQFQYADGLKTGHTNDAGYCLVASAKKDGMRLISVILGSPSDQSRTEDSIRLLTYGFRFYETHKLYSKNTPVVQARTWQGQQSETPLGFPEDLYITLPTGQFKELRPTLVLNGPLKAPIVKGQPYGQLNILLKENTLASKPLFALMDNPTGGLLRRMADAVRYTVHKLFKRSDEQLNNG